MSATCKLTNLHPATSLPNSQQAGISLPKLPRARYQATRDHPHNPKSTKSFKPPNPTLRVLTLPHPVLPTKTPIKVWTTLPLLASRLLTSPGPLLVALYHVACPLLSGSVSHEFFFWWHCLTRCQSPPSIKPPGTNETQSYSPQNPERRSTLSSCSRKGS